MITSVHRMSDLKVSQLVHSTPGAHRNINKENILKIMATGKDLRPWDCGSKDKAISLQKHLLPSDLPDGGRLRNY